VISIFLTEIFLLVSSISLVYTLYLLNLKKVNVNSLKLEIDKKNLEFVDREKRLNDTIKVLETSFASEKKIIEEFKKEFILKEQNLLKENADLSSKLNEETENRKKITSQKKSSEVRLGGIAETLAPFLDQFDFEPEECTFLGKPIDYISFADDEITFIEVKSGNSKLNARQRHIRDQIKSKLVSWKEIKIK
jgi:predicted Holliday junction resolvase-like endonuclease